MIIFGAGGHAKELLDVIGKDETNVSFFDNISKDIPNKLFDEFEILRNEAAVQNAFETDNRFALGIGDPKARRRASELFRNWGGVLTSIISHSAIIGSYNIVLKIGINIMHRVIVSSDVYIGEGTLVNAAAIIHHNVVIGDYCEISPAATLLGDVRVGNYSSIGAGAIILPKISIGSNVIIGAGAVVTKNVEDNISVAGVPARRMIK
jgi:sugar O-acyltransferase (sialic acid O-acetyltransferase NeuD family)